MVDPGFPRGGKNPKYGGGGGGAMPLDPRMLCEIIVSYPFVQFLLQLQKTYIFQLVRWVLVEINRKVLLDATRKKNSQRHCTKQLTPPGFLFVSLSLHAKLMIRKPYYPNRIFAFSLSRTLLCEIFITGRERLIRTRLIRSST